MWIKFETVNGTGAGFGLVAAGDPCLAPKIDGAGDDCCADTTRLFASVIGVGRGGGNGEIETAETDAEWAW